MFTPSGGRHQHCTCHLDMVYNLTLAGQQHCVITSFYSCDPGVSPQLCVVCPTWSFLSHSICCSSAPRRKHPVGSGHLPVLLTFGVAECGWTHTDPIDRTPLSATVCRSRKAVTHWRWQSNTFLVFPWLVPGLSEIAPMQIANRPICALFLFSEGACLWFRCGASQVQVSARNEQQIGPWSQQSWGNGQICLRVNVCCVCVCVTTFCCHTVASCHASPNASSMPVMGFFLLFCFDPSWSPRWRSCTWTWSCTSVTLSGWTTSLRSTTITHCPSCLR